VSTDPLCPHGRKICSEHIVVDDAAKRAYDVVQSTVAHNDWDTLTHYPYLAIRLSDGGSDGKLYATKAEAVRHQLHENLCAYYSFRNAPTGFSALPMKGWREAAIFLAFNRAAYDAGFRLVDPDDRQGGPDLVMPSMNEHLQNQLSRLIGGRRG